MRRVLTCFAAMMALTSCGANSGGNQTAEEVAEELEAVKLEPGQWEATNEILSASARGVTPEQIRQMIGQKTKVSNCVTPEQAAKPSANFLSAQQNSDCTYQDFSMDGGRMRGSMSCGAPGVPGKMVMTMEGSYGPRRYEMNMNMQSAGMPGGMNMTVKARTIGRRIGACA